MIIGHGIDIVELASIERFSHDEAWKARCFSQAELAGIPDGSNRLAIIASRFAAKEAVLKSLGCGYGAGVAFTDVEISEVDGLPPNVTVFGGAKDRANELKVTHILLSITHTKNLACASAIAVSE